MPKMSEEKMRILARFAALELEQSLFRDLGGLCVGKNIINNPNAIRYDCPITRDIIFYEDSHAKK